jgi:hypothetical protein
VLFLDGIVEQLINAGRVTRQLEPCCSCDGVRVPHTGGPSVHTQWRRCRCGGWHCEDCFHDYYAERMESDEYLCAACAQTCHQEDMLMYCALEGADDVRARQEQPGSSLLDDLPRATAPHRRPPPGRQQRSPAPRRQPTSGGRTSRRTTPAVVPAAAGTSKRAERQAALVAKRALHAA